MRVFVPQPVHGGFLSQMTFLFPDFEWVLEGKEYIWSPTLAPSSIAIGDLFNIQKLKYNNKSINETDLKQFDLTLTVVETHHNNKKLRESDRPIIWRNYYGILKGRSRFNGPIIYASKCIRNLSATPGEVIYETRNPDIYDKWVGDRKFALAVASNLKARHIACGGPILDRINDAIPMKRIINKQPIDKNKLIALYKSCRVYVDAAPDVRKISYARVFSGSFIEAMMCGAPTVVTNTNEFGLIIDHGINGFKCSTASEMISHIKTLLQDHILAKKIGTAARIKALKIYNPTSIKQQWMKAFKAAGAL